MGKKCEKDHIIIRDNIVDESTNSRGIIMVESKPLCTDPDCPELKGE